MLTGSTASHRARRRCARATCRHRWRRLPSTVRQVWTRGTSNTSSLIFAQHYGPFTALGGNLNGQWSVYTVLDFWMGRADKLDPCTFPSFVLYQKHRFKPFRAYIDRQDTYETWLPAQGFTEGESLCAAYSECTGEDLTALFELSGWQLAPERVAQARKLLAESARGVQ